MGFEHLCNENKTENWTNPKCFHKKKIDLTVRKKPCQTPQQEMSRLKRPKIGDTYFAKRNPYKAMS